jgi:hypothetical protein
MECLTENITSLVSLNVGINININCSE